MIKRVSSGSFFGLVLAAVFAAPPAAAADPHDSVPAKMLFVTQSEGYVHQSVRRPDGQLAPAEIAVREMAQETGLFSVDFTQDVEADFTPDNLDNYDIVAFYTSGDLPIPEATRNYFFDQWLRESGHGFFGFHAALDTYVNDEPYWDMVGGSFIGHAWHSKDTVTLRVHEPKHPIIEPFAALASVEPNEFGDPGFVLKEEIYQYRHWQPEKVRVLMSLDYSASPTKAGVPVGFQYHVPVAWVKEYGDGRVFVNNLGHNETTWGNPAFRTSIANAVLWMRGDLDVPAAPNPEVSAREEVKAEADFAAGDFVEIAPKKVPKSEMPPLRTIQQK